MGCDIKLQPNSAVSFLDAGHSEKKHRFALLIIEQLTILYGERVALKNATLSIFPKQLTALVGPSGCGKSSLLHSINRMTDLISDCKVEGSIRFQDQNILSTECDLTWLRSQIGIVFQQPNPFPLSIFENIAFPLREHGVKSKPEIQLQVTAVLKQVGLWEEVKDRLHKNALSLSGGQQQRLCIARAIALKPSVLLMDEPCSALDPISSQKIESLIVELKKSFTILMVTHNLAQARRLADQVAVCWVDAGCGCIIEQGSAESVFDNPVHPVTAAFCGGELG